MCEFVSAYVWLYIFVMLPCPLTMKIWKVKEHPDLGRLVDEGNHWLYQRDEMILSMWSDEFSLR